MSYLCFRFLTVSLVMAVFLTTGLFSSDDGVTKCFEVDFSFIPEEKDKFREYKIHLRCEDANGKVFKETYTSDTRGPRTDIRDLMKFHLEENGWTAKFGNGAKLMITDHQGVRVVNVEVSVEGLVNIQVPVTRISAKPKG